MTLSVSHVTSVVLILQVLATVGAYEASIAVNGSQSVEEFSVALIDETGLSPEKKNFLSAFNGYFSNTKQILEEVAKKETFIHSFTSLLMVPYKVPALPGRQTLFFEQRYGDLVFRRSVLSISEDDQSRIVAEVFDLPIANNDVPGSYSIENLNNLTPEELSSRAECSPMFTEVSELLFTGIWPDCSQDYVGERPYYSLTLTCTVFNASTHTAAREISGGAPFILDLETEKTPSPYYDNEDDPCTKGTETP